jgi:SNF2 family DNA or RNA helicase
MFVGELHDFQIGGVERIVQRRQLLLAYDMGTGKTVVAIAAIEQLLGEGRIDSALIVVPASLRWQWAARVAQFADVDRREITLKGTALTVPSEEHCLVLDGHPAARMNQYRRISRRCPDYLIVSYETATSDWKELRKLAPDAIVLDEAQMIKNAGALRTKKIKRLTAPYRIGLTGTPMDNGNPEEIFSVMEWVDAAVFGRWDLFDHCYVIRNKNRRPVGYDNLDVLYRTLSEAMERRTLADPSVARTMPRVERARVEVELDARTRTLYARIERDVERALECAREEGASALDVEALYSGVHARGTGSRALGALAARMTCARLLLDHPQLLRISAAKREDSDQGGGSGYAAELARGGLLDDLDETPKLDALTRCVAEQLADPRSKVIVFTRYREMLTLLVKALKNYNPVAFHGELDASARAAAIARFNEPQCRAFISTDAGGVGLDLPMADCVINYDQAQGAGPARQRNTRHTRANSPHPRVRVVDLIARDTLDVHDAARLEAAHLVARASVDNSGARRAGRATLGAHLDDARKQRRAQDERAHPRTRAS